MQAVCLRRFPSAVRAFTACRDALRTLHDLAERHRHTAERRRQEEMFEPPAFLSPGARQLRAWKAAVSADLQFGEAHDAVRAAEEAGFRVNPQLKSEIAGL